MMDEGPLTFRDHALSIFQSAAADFARKDDAARPSQGALESRRPKASQLEEAAAQVAAIRHAQRTDSQPHSGVALSEE
jgi:hypothetical protein